MEKDKYNKILELEKELTDFDFAEKMILCEYSSPDFFLELYRGNYKKSCRIVVDDNKISIESLENNEIIDKKIVNDKNVINEIKKLVFNNKKNIVDLSLKLSPEYIMNNGIENSYNDNMLLKFGNLILKINNGSVKDNEANKIFDSIYEIIV